MAPTASVRPATRPPATSRASINRSRKPSGRAGSLASGLAAACAAGVWLRASAAGRGAVTPGEPVAGAQGAGRTLELPRRLLRRPAPGLPGAVVAAAAAAGAQWRNPNLALEKSAEASAAVALASPARPQGGQLLRLRPRPGRREVSGGGGGAVRVSFFGEAVVAST
ncbi:uncharacterized protein LOC118154017 isoform X1 [Callithrix jacchus]